ncbi:MAG: HEPN domain-containing protein [Phycisphaeraceae bacterium]
MATWTDLSRESFRAAKLAMGDACYRSSVSRSYYAAYAAVSQVLEEKGLAFGNDREGPPHAHIREMIDTNVGQLRPRGAPRVRAAEKHRLKTSLNVLYENRLDADYRPSRAVNEDVARNSLIAASSVLGTLGIAL